MCLKTLDASAYFAVGCFEEDVTLLVLSVWQEANRFLDVYGESEEKTALGCAKHDYCKNSEAA